MKFGLSREHWQLVDALALEPLRKLGCEVFVYGSRARGDHRKFSDLDVLLEHPKGVSLAVLGNIHQVHFALVMKAFVENAGHTPISEPDVFPVTCNRFCLADMFRFGLC